VFNVLVFSLKRTSIFAKNESSVKTQIVNQYSKSVNISTVIIYISKIGDDDIDQRIIPVQQSA